jgi:Na+-driven multidrug efflux pump
MKTKPVVVLVLIGICLGFAACDSTPACGWRAAKWLAILFSALFGLLIYFLPEYWPALTTITSSLHLGRRYLSGLDGHSGVVARSGAFSAVRAA